MKNTTLLSALLGSKCPNCRQGKIFRYDSWALNKFSKVNSRCNHCGTYYEQEPGFLIGAMYINYMFSVAAVVGPAIILANLPYDIADKWYYIAALFFIFTTIPWAFRASRVIYLYVFGRFTYHPEAAEGPDLLDRLSIPWIGQKQS